MGKMQLVRDGIGPEAPESLSFTLLSQWEKPRFGDWAALFLKTKLSCLKCSVV